MTFMLLGHVISSQHTGSVCTGGKGAGDGIWKVFDHIIDFFLLPLCAETPVKVSYFLLKINKRSSL